MEKVRAKFKCNSIEHFEYNSTAKFSAVTSGDGDNKDFAEATPWGELNIMIQGDVPADKFFETGKEYYLDFTKAE